MGVFDEGCMGMYNAIIPDELLHPTGRVQGAAQPVERSTPRCAKCPTTRPAAVRTLAGREGHEVRYGPNPETDLTDEQILDQCKMYIAALRIADDFGCDIDRHPVSAGAEGPDCRRRTWSRALLNNVDRPPVKSAADGRVLYEGRALPHFNEVDECAGLDALVTNRVWTRPWARAGDHAARRALGRGPTARTSCGCS